MDPPHRFDMIELVVPKNPPMPKHEAWPATTHQAGMVAPSTAVTALSGLCAEDYSAPGNPGLGADLDGVPECRWWITCDLGYIKRVG
jgi:hypothetical protein